MQGAVRAFGINSCRAGQFGCVFQYGAGADCKSVAFNTAQLGAVRAFGIDSAQRSTTSTFFEVWPLPAWQKRCQSVLVVDLTGFDRTRNESRIECGNDAVLFVGFDCFCELNGSDDL